MKYRYFVAYLSGMAYGNTELISNRKITGIDEVRKMEVDLKNELKVPYVTVINFIPLADSADVEQEKDHHK